VNSEQSCHQFLGNERLWKVSKELFEQCGHVVDGDVLVEDDVGARIKVFTKLETNIE